MFLLLIIGCLVSGIWGLHEVQIVKNKAVAAVKIHETFDQLMILFEKNLMGPHDYLIHGNMEEKYIFLKDYEKLLKTKEKLTNMIFIQKSSHGPEFEKILRKADELLFTIENKLPKFKAKVMDIFSLNFPIEGKAAGNLMEEMDAYIRELEENLEKEINIFLTLSDRCMEEINIIHSQVFFWLILLSIAAIFIGIIVIDFQKLTYSKNAPMK